MGAFDGASDFQTVDPRQIDFHNDHVGVEQVNDLDRLLAIACFADDVKFARFGQMVAQSFTKQRMRIDQHYRGWIHPALLL
jgi:hypothetical protein